MLLLAFLCGRFIIGVLKISKKHLKIAILVLFLCVSGDAEISQFRPFPGYGSALFHKKHQISLRNRISRTNSLRQSVALRDRVAVRESVVAAVSLRAFHLRALE